MKERKDKPATPSPSTRSKTTRRKTAATAVAAASEPSKVAKEPAVPTRKGGKPLSAKYALEFSYVEGFNHRLLGLGRDLEPSERKELNDDYQKWMDARMQRGGSAAGTGG